MTLTEHNRLLTADVCAAGALPGTPPPSPHPGQFVNHRAARPLSAPAHLRLRLGRGDADAAGPGGGRGHRRSWCQAQPGTVFDLLSGLGNGFDPDECTGTPHPDRRRHRHRPPSTAWPSRMAQNGKRPHRGPGLQHRCGCLLSRGVRRPGLPRAVVHGGRLPGRPRLRDGAGRPRPECDYCFCLRPGAHAAGGAWRCPSSPAASSALKSGWAAASAPAWAAPCETKNGPQAGLQGRACVPKGGDRVARPLCDLVRAPSGQPGDPRQRHLRLRPGVCPVV